MTIAALGMQDDLRRLGSISQNLANVSTPGYKREIPVTQAFHAIMQTMITHQDGDLASAEILSPHARDVSAGTFRYTANPLDLVMEGEGFFEVMTAQGPAYTRQAALKTDALGRLVTQQGLPIMGVEGELSVSGTPTITRDGEVQQENRIVGQIKVVQFANPHTLTSLGNGLFGPGATSVRDTEKSVTLRTGYQENSNVNSPQEMVRLTEIVRHFESLQKIMQGYEDTLEKSIRKLSEF